MVYIAGMVVESFNIENHKAQLKKGTLEFCILLIISKGQIYTSDILAELKQANLIVVEGTLYPLLSRLKSSGLLSYSWVESQSGPPRKYYSLTPAGTEALKKLKENWAEYTQAINKLINLYEENN